MIKKIQIKFKPVTLSIARANKAVFKVVTGAEIALEATGAGVGLATDADQDAVIEFFEGQDKAKPLGTLMSTFKMNNGVPEFKISTVVSQRAIRDEETDFRVKLEFASVNFPSSTSFTFTLNLPYAVPNLNINAPSAGNLTVGAHLRLGGVNDINNRRIATAGTIEGAAFKDKLDIPMLQPEVEDADDASVKHVLIGPASSGHPIGLVFTSPTQPPKSFSIARAGTTFEILLHVSVEDVCNRISANSFSQPALEANINAILSPGGFAAITFTRTATTAAFGQIWRPNKTSRLVATSLPDPDAIDGGSVPFNVGNVTPFFQYLVHAANSAQPKGDELAFSESLDSIQVGAKTKRVLSPINLVAGSGSPFRQNYGLATDKMRFLANLIAHEIGHALGLGHAHAAKSASAPTHDLDGGVTLLAGKNAPDAPLKKLGPVHTAVLKKAYP
jgi:hypothetical protein